ncbi:MAG: YerC/YecD family TrpR-related protein [Oscillospiraceae bacterium]
MAKTVSKEHSMELYETISSIKSADECYRFFQDICSITELRTIEQRFEVARLLSEGQVYTDIMEKAHASSATISRVNRVLNYGTGTLSELLDRRNGGMEK